MQVNCTVCPGCGAWVVIHRDTSTPQHKGKSLVKCPNPRCVNEDFEIENWLIRQFDIEEGAYQQRYFYPESRSIV